MKIRLFEIVCILSLATAGNCIGIIKDLLQFNVAGIPIVHKTYDFPFDPDAGPRKSRDYQEANGRFGAKAIERLGLGEDGREVERLAEQRQRDEGQLGGVREFTP
ncbi:hypothetical protein WA026_007780 [Henosepilachna vigintioctopunctata]|uniref:Uncharacterized protein n=1 Tax=Henosepilachna vigintioctopunctata TaxID=420089 RepID=A0AAW1U383_9CUCU